MWGVQGYFHKCLKHLKESLKQEFECYNHANVLISKARLIADNLLIIFITITTTTIMIIIIIMLYVSFKWLSLVQFS